METAAESTTERVEVQRVNIKPLIEQLKETHPGVIRDVKKSKAIPLDARCKRCDGTGNELYAMYRQCQACKGDGTTRHNEGEFDN